MATEPYTPTTDRLSAEPPKFGEDTWQGRALRRFYTGRPGWEDGSTFFHRYMVEHAPRRGPALELGPGPTNRTTRLIRDNFERVDGLDVDPDSRTNEHLTTAYVYDGGAWPTPDNTYDAIFADFVFEHIPEPTQTLSEARRCLRPGGVLIFRTPNLWHYVTLASAATPHWVHTALVSRLKRNTADMHDPYPTHYRLNTARSVRSHARAAGLEVANITRLEREPSYGMLSPLLFYPFMLYERAVNSTGMLEWARSVLIATLRKPAAAPTSA